MKVKGLQSNDTDWNESQLMDNNKAIPNPLQDLETQDNGMTDHIGQGNLLASLEELSANFDNSEVALVQMKEDEQNHADTDINIQIDQMIEKNDGQWQCKVCGKTAESSQQKWNLKNHIETHLKGVSHVCSICSKTLATRNSLTVHIANVHSDIVYTCHLCNKSGMTKVAFNNHKQRMHKV